MKPDSIPISTLLLLLCVSVFCPLALAEPAGLHPSIPISADNTSFAGEDQINTRTFTYPGDILAKIPVTGTIDTIPFPIYAHLLGRNGEDYVLVRSSRSNLNASGLAYEILDDGTGNPVYAIARTRPDQAYPDITKHATILFDDRKNLVLKTERDRDEELLKTGLQIRWLDQPRVIHKPVTAAEAVGEIVPYDPRIASMISRITQEDLYAMSGQLSGEEPIQVDGKNYTLETRLTNSGEPIRIATAYAYEYLNRLNLSVSYQNWTWSGYSSRNVIATSVGTTYPDEIILVTAHIDSISQTDRAPGADDNGSGTVAVLALAKAMDQFRFERTVRFVLFTGEEQGLLGSDEYAAAALGKGENIVAVLNMDMIAWSKNGRQKMEIHTRIPSDTGGYAQDMQIATVFNQSVSLYGLQTNITPGILSDGDEYSDQYSFWSCGFPAILASEDYYDDFNPYYHSDQDLRKNLNMAYFTGLSKACLAATAHLAVPADSSETGLAARFIADEVSGNPPLSVRFTDMSIGSPSRWHWSFGDGGSSDAQNPVHVYQGVGRYTVTLSVSNQSCSNITRIPEYITTTSKRIAGPGGWVSISSSPPYARVYIDSDYIGNTPVIASGITPGNHQVQVLKQGYKNWIGYTRVRPGECTYVPHVVLQHL